MLEFPGPEVFEAVVDRIESGVYVIDGSQRVVYWEPRSGKDHGFADAGNAGTACAGNLGLEVSDHNPTR
jgi:hypothetical protein